MIRNRLMDVMMKILLPACFIALKLTGSFIDFMLGLANSSVHEDIEISTSQVRDSQLQSHLWDQRYRESFITVVDDILALNGSSVVVMNSLVSKGTYTLKYLFGNKIVESFSFRTCVKPKVSENRFGQAEIIYESLTAQDLLRKKILRVCKLIFVKIKVFEASKVCEFRWRPSVC